MITVHNLGHETVIEQHYGTLFQEASMYIAWGKVDTQIGPLDWNCYVTANPDGRFFIDHPKLKRAVAKYIRSHPNCVRFKFKGWAQ